MATSRTAFLLAAAIATVVLLILLQGDDAGGAPISAEDRPRRESSARTAPALARDGVVDDRQVATDGEVAAASAQELALAFRWSDLFLPVDAVTGAVVDEAHLVRVTSDGVRHELELDAFVRPSDLAAGSLLALDGPGHVVRAFWPRALGLDVEDFGVEKLGVEELAAVDPETLEPRRVALDPAATLRVECSGDARDGSEDLVVRVDLDHRDGFALALGRSFGFDDANAEFDAIRLGDAVGHALGFGAGFGDDDEWRRRGMSRLAELVDAAPLNDLDARPLVMGRRQRSVASAPLEFTELTAGAPYALEVPWMDDRDVRVGVRGTGSWYETESLPLVLERGEVRIVDLELRSYGTVFGRVPLPVRSIHPTIGAIRPRDPSDPSAGPVETRYAGFVDEEAASFRFEQVPPGPVRIDVRWIDELGVQSRAERSIEVEPGRIVDLGLLEAPTGATLWFEPRVVIDGVVEPLELDDAFYEILLFPRGPGSDGSASEEAQRTGLEPFGMAGVPPGDYSVYLGPLAITRENASHYRVVSSTLDVERDLNIDGDRTIGIEFELARISTTRVVAALPSVDPARIPATYGVKAVAWNRATDEVVQSVDASSGLMLWLGHRGDGFAELPLSSGAWSIAMTLVPRMIDVESPPVAGAIPSWIATGEVTVDAATGTGPVRLEWQPATVIVAPVRRHAAPVHRSAAVVPSDWPDAAATLWSAWGSALDEPTRIHGCLPLTSHREPGSALDVVSAAAGSAIEIVE